MTLDELINELDNANADYLDENGNKEVMIWCGGKWVGLGRVDIQISDTIGLDFIPKTYE
jgi:hypothetical protein